MQLVRGDVIVVGGGLEGTLLARHLHQLGQKVILLEQGGPRDPNQAYHPWACSPFLYPPWLWPWILDSRTYWEERQCWRPQSGLALAQRQSPSWLRLLEIQEQLGLTCPQDQGSSFPELQEDAELGCLSLSNLPSLALEGLQVNLWKQMQRQGLDPWAHTRVERIDWEHESPTAISGSTIFRARRLVLCCGSHTPKLLPLELPPLSQEQLWLEGQPQLENRGPSSRPLLWIHYAKAPVYLVPGEQTWGWGRLWQPESLAGEVQFLEEIPQRWLTCSLVKQQLFRLKLEQTPDGLPIVERHPWRDDCLWLAGFAQPHWAWLPQLLPLLSEPQAQLPEALRLARFLSRPVSADSNG